MHRHCVNKNYDINLLYSAKCQIDNKNAACPDFATPNRPKSLKWTWPEKCKNLLCPQSFVERTLGCGMVVFVHSWNKTLFYHPGCYCCYLALCTKTSIKLLEVLFLVKLSPCSRCRSEKWKQVFINKYTSSFSLPVTLVNAVTMVNGDVFWGKHEVAQSG